MWPGLALGQNRLARDLVSADIRTRIIDLMNTLNWSKLDQRWKLHILLTTFKCLKGDAPVYLSSQFSFATHSHHTRGQTFNTLIVPFWKSNSGKRTFYYRASKLWNNLPNDIRYNYKSMSMLSFKEVLNAPIVFLMFTSYILISLHFQRGKLCWYCNKLLLYTVNYSNFVLTNQTLIILL